MNRSTGNVTLGKAAVNSSIPGLFQLLYQQRTELFAWIGLTIALSFAGIFFNLAALSVTFWRRTRESVFNLLMSHFVAINLFICLVNLPIHAFMVLAKFRGVEIPPVACGPIQFFFAFGCAVCNWADVCLSVNRFIAIVVPMHYKWWTSKWVNLAMVTFGWSICTAATLPMAFKLGGSMPLLPTGQCGFLPSGKWGLLITCINSYIPYGIIASASLSIWVKILLIQRANSRIRSADKIKPAVISRKRLIVARMLLMTTVWSAICNLPWGIIQFNYPIFYTTKPVSILWLRTVQAVQYGFSPLVLYLTNEDYRKRFRALIALFFGGASGNRPVKVTSQSHTGQSGPKFSHGGTKATVTEKEIDID